jgi:PAS domain S-box-containing protein
MQDQQTFYFIRDRAVIAYCLNEIQKRSLNVPINFSANFEELFFKMASEYTKESIICANFHFFEAHELIKEFIINSNMSIKHYIINQNIDGVKINFIHFRNIANYNSYYINQGVVSKYYMLGDDIHRNKKNIWKNIMEKANDLQLFKKIYVDNRNLNLNEYLDEFTSNILKQFKAEFGCVFLQAENSGKKSLFKKVYNKQTIRNYDFGKELVVLPTREKVENINSIENNNLREELKTLKIKYHIILPIKSVNAKGYLDFFSMLDAIGYAEHELIKAISKYITLLIDNTYFFQKMLKRKGSLSNILSGIDDGVMIVNKDRIVLSLNEFMENIIGWRERDALGKPCKYLYHSCNALGESLCDSKNCPMFEPLYEMKDVTLEKVFTLDKSGKRKILRSKYLPDRDNEFGHSYYGVAIVRDLTERVQLEEKLQRFEQLASLGTFAATLAHEIRNPITGISSNAQFLYEENNITGVNRDIIKDIIRGAHAIEETISKLVNLVNPIKVNLSHENINHILQDVIDFLKKKIEYSGINLDVSFNPLIPLICLNKSLIKQVFMNVIMNAIQSMESGGILTIQTLLANNTKMIDHKTKGHVQVIVTDTGIGIENDNLIKIFDPFFTTKNTGLGLGLYSAYKILKSYHAAIEVRSSRGKGTTVIINFKIKL